MEISSAIFYLLASFILVSGILAVTSLKIFRSAVYLLFTMMGIAGLYFWLDFQFIAAVQIIVYVGGIVVLIIFSIFLTHHVGSEMEQPRLSRTLIALAATVLTFLITLTIILKTEFLSDNAAAIPLTVKRIGEQMLSINEHGYILPFEVISMLLLASMIGCIVIALKPIVSTDAK